MGNNNVWNIDSIINTPPFSVSQKEKNVWYAEAINQLTRHHYAHCPSYQKLLNKLNIDPAMQYDLEDVPFVPVRLFKEYSLMSVDPSQVIKTLTSSGTTGQKVSRIFLDKITATYQTKVLTKIVANFLGQKRLPLLVMDTPSAIKNRNLFSARGAGILGFSMFGYDVTYALDDAMQIDWDAIEGFCNKYRGKPILIFGFTYMIWEYFYKRMAEYKRHTNLENGILIHGGGWKRLYEQAIDNETFKQLLRHCCGIKSVHNYYGMVEQTGSIFMECEYGYLHSSIFSDIMIRDAHFCNCGMHTKGLVQLYSVLPWSYPGHSILTEDLGEIVGEDDCLCGRLGKYFKIDGRIQNAEIRGCSDVYAAK